MVTPLDIQSIEFAKAVRGYKEEEVDEFLDKLTIDYEAVITERDELKAQLEEANRKIDEYKTQEGAVLKTLESAKALMNDISASSEKRAQILIRNAELDAQNIRREAEESLGVLKDEEIRLIQRVSNFKARYKSLLESELEKFDDFSDELLGIPSGPNSLKKNAEVVPAAAPSDLAAGFAGGADDDLQRTITNLRGDL